MDELENQLYEAVQNWHMRQFSKLLMDKLLKNINFLRANNQ